MNVAPYFRIEKKETEEIINKTIKMVSKWRSLATKYSISRLEQENKSKAFIE